MTEFDGYANGWRAGMFDKCNGRAEMSFSGWDLDVPYNEGFAEGYVDGWMENDLQMAA